MGTSFNAAARSVVAAAARLSSAARRAQSPAVSPKEADQAKQQQIQQLTQPLNNAPVWKEIRSGEKQYTSVPGRETNVLIQPQGQTWRAVRVPLATVGGFLFAAALVVLGAFYLWRGPITVRGAPTGRLIERFTLVERTVHWARGHHVHDARRHRPHPHVRQDGAVAAHRLHAVLVARDPVQEPAQLRRDRSSSWCCRS